MPNINARVTRPRTMNTGSIHISSNHIKTVTVRVTSNIWVTCITCRCARTLSLSQNRLIIIERSKGVAVFRQSKPYILTVLCITGKVSKEILTIISTCKCSHSKAWNACYNHQNCKKQRYNFFRTFKFHFKFSFLYLCPNLNLDIDIAIHFYIIVILIQLTYFVNIFR